MKKSLILITAVIMVVSMVSGCKNNNKGLFLPEAKNDKTYTTIGGADEPTDIKVTDGKNKIKRSYDIDRYLKDNYVDERKLPVLDIDIENPFISDDRTLILNDSAENSLELMIYEYYHSLMSGTYKKAKEMIIDGSLLAATEAYENNFKNGIYYSQISIDEIDLVDKEDLDNITNQNKQAIVELLDDLDMTEFAIVEVEITIKHNEKTLSVTPHVGDGDVERFFVLGKKDDSYKIVDVYWEGFMND